MGRIGEAARPIGRGGTVALCSFISPLAAARRVAPKLVEVGEFVEMFVDAPIERCIASGRRAPRLC